MLCIDQATQHQAITTILSAPLSSRTKLNSFEKTGINRQKLTLRGLINKKVYNYELWKQAGMPALSLFDLFVVYLIFKNSRI